MNLFFVLTLREILKFYSVYTSEKNEMIIEKNETRKKYAET